MVLNTARITNRNIEIIAKNKFLPIFICRYMNPMVEKYKGSPIHIIDLAPSSDLLFSIKNNKIGFEEYSTRYIEEISRLDMNEILGRIYNLIVSSNATGAVLMCYCKDVSKCHRGLLAKYLYENKYLDYKPKELII